MPVAEKEWEYKVKGMLKAELNAGHDLAGNWLTLA